LAFWNWEKNKHTNKNIIKIGVIADLSGPVAAWGESTKVGTEVAKTELNDAGYKVNIIYEDYQLDPAKALTAAQKLINTDKVDAIYAEFNPAAYSIAPFLKDKNIPWIYDAAPTSPLDISPYAYKSYLDYEQGCVQLAEYYKSQGVQKLGSLELNWEPGKLCTKGLQSVYQGNDLLTETYDANTLDLKTQVTKLKMANVGAIINAGLEPDTLTTLKAIQDLGFDVPYGTVSDSATTTVQNKYPEQFKKTTIFGFGDIDSTFLSRVKANNSNLTSYYGAALAYTHIRQLVKSITGCGAGEINCIKTKLDKSPSDKTIGFKGFVNRIANFETIVSSAKVQ